MSMFINCYHDAHSVGRGLMNCDRITERSLLKTDGTLYAFRTVEVISSRVLQELFVTMPSLKPGCAAGRRGKGGLQTGLHWRGGLEPVAAGAGPAIW